MEKHSVKLTLPVPRGMLFLYDHLASDIEIPPYSESKTIGLSETAISIATISDLDGDTSILLTNSPNEFSKNTVELFSGQIFSETGNIHICLMGNEPVAQMPTTKGLVNLDIYGDVNQYPKSVAIFISP